MFVGRRKELELLEDAYHSTKSELVVIYGRRRIGKSSLVNHFAREKPYFFPFEAVEGETTQNQIRHFTVSLRKHTGDQLLDHVDFKNWEQVFSYITDRLM
ncbi:MAG: ATP-binding protein [Candidatus Aminicenantes bacterium]|nr:ATP-binding protein [Candidatus Aminicenantes bacterium]